MKIPEFPPSLDEIFRTLDKDNKIFMFLNLATRMTDDKGRYLHWEKVKHLPAPEGLSSQEYWGIIKLARRQAFKKLPFVDKLGKPFVFCTPDNLLRELHWLDQQATGSIHMNRAIIHKQTRDTYLVHSLVEESISSSQLEGASTTRNVAKEMLRQARTPNNHSEQMIYNNYQAMKLISEFKNEELTPSLILHLHEILTENTLDDARKAGQYRDNADDIHIVGNQSVVLHTPPDAKTLPARMQKLCDFANKADETVFIHPVLKAITLHFMLGYDHPFVDGNGRTARALFYWAMARQGYWLTEFISISKIIKEAPVQYCKAYLHTETDDNDVTYFLIHQMEVIRKGISALQQYLENKANEIEEVEQLLDNSKAQLNYRQLSLLKHALENPNAIYSIQEHQAAHAISYQTARTDLLKMSDELCLLRKRKYGHSFAFILHADLKTQLMQK